MTEQTTDIQASNDFNQVLGIINFHRQRVSKAVDDESLRMIWEVGAYKEHEFVPFPLAQIPNILFPK